MGALRKWFSNSSPLVKTLSAVSITSMSVVCYRMFYEPYAKRTRYRQAEEWANAIIEQEEMGEAGLSNIK